MLHYNPQHVSSSTMLVFRRKILLLHPLVSSLSLNGCTVYRLRTRQCAPTLTSIQDLFHPNSWQTPVAAVTVYSAPDDGRRGRPKHVLAQNRPWTSIQDLFQPNSWQTPVAAVTVYSGPDDGCKGRPKLIGPIRSWNITVFNRPWTSVEDLFHPNSW